MPFSGFTLKFYLMSFLNFYYVNANLCVWNQINWYHWCCWDRPKWTFGIKNKLKTWSFLSDKIYLIRVIKRHHFLRNFSLIRMAIQKLDFTWQRNKAVSCIWRYNVNYLLKQFSPWNLKISCKTKISFLNTSRGC